MTATAVTRRQDPSGSARLFVGPIEGGKSVLHIEFAAGGLVSIATEP